MLTHKNFTGLEYIWTLPKMVMIVLATFNSDNVGCVTNKRLLQLSNIN